MKNFLIFFSIVLLIYGSVNFYIYIRGYQAFVPKFPQFKLLFILLFLGVALSFFAGRILENYYVSSVSDMLVHVGSFYLAFMLYFFLFIVSIDLIRLLNHFLGFLPQALFANYTDTKFYTGLAVVIITSALVIAGHINALSPRLSRLEIRTAKEAGELKKLNIVMASDIHLGTMIRNSRVDKLVQSINEQKPDIVLLPGDIIDEDLAPVIRLNLGEALRGIKSKYGVYAVTGNHEYIGGASEAVKYLTEHGIQILRDSAVLIDNSFYVVGREDISINRFANKTRRPLPELVRELDKAKPIILMDHQPFKLEEASQNGIDLQLSGHTHHGQLWPANYITEMVYEVSQGYKKKGDTHYYVSSGFGGWGPPVRLGNRPEIVRIELLFGK